MENDRRILNIAFFARPAAWMYKVKNHLTDEQKREYFSSPLPDLAFSIARKFELVKTCVNNAILESHEINKLLKQDEKNVNHCISTGKAYVFSDIHHIYNMIAYTEAVLTNTKSCIGFIISYIKQFYRVILRQKIKKFSDLKLLLADNSISIDWKEDLDKIRNDLIHNHSAWIFFLKTNYHHKLVLSLPKSIRRRGGYIQFPHDTFDTDDINSILREFQKFFSQFENFIVNKIEASKLSEASGNQ